MKNKITFPLIAFVLAIGAAFASNLSAQVAWYKPMSGPAIQGAITVPANTTTNPCRTSGSVQCKIGAFNAYDTQQNANNAPSPVGLLKYN